MIQPARSTRLLDSCPWCANWCTNHPTAFECQITRSGDCAHTDKLQCALKAQAFWQLMARWRAGVVKLLKKRGWKFIHAYRNDEIAHS